MYKLLIVCCFIIFTSCGILDEDDDYFNGTMQAKVNDKLIIFKEAYGERNLSLETWEWGSINNIVGITNMNVSGAKINISSSFLFNPEEGATSHPSCYYIVWTGNYDDNNLTVYYPKRLPETSQGSQFSSTVVLTSITNKRYNGTFSFTAYDDEQNPTDSIVVTNGMFEIDSDGKKW